MWKSFCIIMEIFCSKFAAAAAVATAFLIIYQLTEPLSTVLFYLYDNKCNWLFKSIDRSISTHIFHWLPARMPVRLFFAIDPTDKSIVCSFDWIFSINCTYVTNCIEWHITDGYTLTLAHPFHFLLSVSLCHSLFGYCFFLGSSIELSE